MEVVNVYTCIRVLISHTCTYVHVHIRTYMYTSSQSELVHLQLFQCHLVFFPLCTYMYVRTYVHVHTCTAAVAVGVTSHPPYSSAVERMDSNVSQTSTGSSVGSFERVHRLQDAILVTEKVRCTYMYIS